MGYATHLGLLQPLSSPAACVHPVHAGYTCDTQVGPLMSARVRSAAADALLSLTITTWPHFASQKMLFFFNLQRHVKFQYLKHSAGTDQRHSHTRAYYVRTQVYF